MPPEVVGKVLRTTVFLPTALDLEGLGIHNKNSPRAAAVSGADCIHVNAIRSTVRSVRPAVSGALQDRLGLDDFYQARLARIRLGIDDVNARGAQTRNEIGRASCRERVEGSEVGGREERSAPR